MTDTPPHSMNANLYFRSPFAPRIHFDEAGSGGGGEGGGQQQQQAKAWHEGLDPEIRGHIDNKGWKVDDPKTVVTEMAKAWKGLEKHFGAPADQILRLPKDATDDAGWSAVRQRLGMPKEPKEYDLTGVKHADGRELDPAFADTMRNALHRAGTAKESATDVMKTVVKHFDGIEQAKVEAQTAKLQADRTALKSEWNENFEFNRLTAMQGAKRAAGSGEAGEKLIAAMEQAVGYKATMEFFRKIGSGTNEDTFVESGSGGNPTTMNGAKARIAELKSDPDWSRRYLGGDLKARQEMDNLIALSVGAVA